ncbi:TetR/AcrR family transcriptional regulator [Magnetofaba australis]|uniref:Putative TetR family transcriptional regulator n=1 Tax=Magnetofaba australis IT-1 TaxID=1434232 RepID=A0A1Y2K786_9PROT|nr:TetR/AcrR family transcriptional regulator [Magnetofaba australis]OSM06177.1 putative TetR family transcriptional regulator [Magnetofaba australis IT-1]
MTTTADDAGKRFSPKAIITREKILAAAMDLFYVNGYHATGVDRIIAHAHVSKGNFFHHFSNKAELAIAVLDWYKERAIRELGIRMPHETDTPAVELMNLLRGMARRSANYGGECDIRGCIFGNFALELSVENEEIRRRIQAAFDDFRSLIRGYLDRAVQLGALRNDWDLEVTSTVILSLVEGALLLDKTAQRPRDVLTVLDYIEGMLRDHAAPTA